MKKQDQNTKKTVQEECDNMERNEEDDGELKQRSKTFLERTETLTPLVDERIKE